MAAPAISIQLVYLALFGRPADPSGLAFYNALTNNGADLSPILTGNARLSGQPEYLDRFEGMNSTGIIQTIYQSLFNHAADLDGLLYWQKTLANGDAANANQPLPFPGMPAYTIETIAVAIALGALGTDQDIVNNKVEAANEFTSSLNADEAAAYNGPDANHLGQDFLSAVTADHATVPDQAAVDAAILNIVENGQAGISINLTSDIDVVNLGAPAPLTATEHNDTIYGVIANNNGTLNSGDNIDGAGGHDILDIVSTSGQTRSVLLNSVEEVRVQVVNGGEPTLNATAWTGVQEIVLHDSGNNDLEIDNLHSNVAFSFINGGDTSEIDVDYDAGAFGGGAGTVSVTVSNTDEAELHVDDLDGGETITGLHITATGQFGDEPADQDFIFSGSGGNASDLTSVVVDGVGGVEVHLDGGANDLATFDASANSGGVTADLSDSDVALTVTGGAGNDSFEVDLDDAVTANLGEGNDSLYIDGLPGGGPDYSDVMLDGQGGPDNLLGFNDLADAETASSDGDFEGHIANFQTLDLSNGGSVSNGEEYTIDLANLDDISDVIVGFTDDFGTGPGETTATETTSAPGTTEVQDTDTFSVGNGSATTEGNLTIGNNTTVHLQGNETADQIGAIIAALNPTTVAANATSIAYDAATNIVTVSYNALHPAAGLTLSNGGTGATLEANAHDGVAYVAPVAESHVLTFTGTSPTDQQETLSIHGVNIDVPIGSTNAQIAQLVLAHSAEIIAADSSIQGFSYNSGDNFVTINFKQSAGDVPAGELNASTSHMDGGILTLENMASGGTVHLDNSIDGILNVNVTDAASHSNDVLNLSFEGGPEFMDGVINVPDVETINITTDGELNDGHYTVALHSDATTINLSGFAGIDFTGGAGTNGTWAAQISTFNASGVTGTGNDGAVKIFGVGDNVAGGAHITGGAGDDDLGGGQHNDTIVGGAGNDHLYGEGGADTLTGGAGNDTFVFDQASDSAGVNVDTITDFTTGEDDIHLNFGPAVSYKGEAAGFVAANTELTHTMNEAVFDTTSHQLYVDVNGDGTIGAGDMVITLTGVTDLAQTDFV